MRTAVNRYLVQLWEYYAGDLTVAGGEVLAEPPGSVARLGPRSELVATGGSSIAHRQLRRPTGTGTGTGTGMGTGA